MSYEAVTEEQEIRKGLAELMNSGEQVSVKMWANHYCFDVVGVLERPGARGDYKLVSALGRVQVSFEVDSVKLVRRWDRSWVMPEIELKPERQEYEN
jgi:hypothetical protein